jgi:hypothetical protein
VSLFEGGEGFGVNGGGFFWNFFGAALIPLAAEVARWHETYGIHVRMLYGLPSGYPELVQLTGTSSMKKIFGFHLRKRYMSPASGLGISNMYLQGTARRYRSCDFWLRKGNSSKFLVRLPHFTRGLMSPISPVCLSSHPMHPIHQFIILGCLSNLPSPVSYYHLHYSWLFRCSPLFFF